MTAATVLGLGHAVVDHVAWLPALPAADSKSNILRSQIQVGGPVPTALVLLSRWGVRTKFVGVVGDDPDGLRIIADLQREGVDPALIHRRRSMQTGFAHVWVEEGTGRRTVASYRPERPVRPEEFLAGWLHRTQVLHLDGWPGETAIQAATVARDAGVTVTLDAGSVRPGMGQLLPLVDVLTGPERFALDFCGTQDLPKAAAQLLNLGPRAVFLTRGEEGASAWSADLESGASPRVWHQPALQVSAVDTNGAGDTFAGAIVFGVLSGWSVSRMLQVATIAAGLKCAGAGNRSALPDLSQVLAHSDKHDGIRDDDVAALQ